MTVFPKSFSQMAKHVAIYFAFILFYSILPAQKIDRIEPPFWWTGMENPELEILIYGKNIGDAKASINYSGVEIVATERVKNKNYLFLRLKMAPGVKAGKIPIKLKGGNVRTTIDYELRSRSQAEAQPRGLDGSDLIYLIMPDRFANGNPENDVIGGTTQPEVDRKDIAARHGGDLKGIIDHLDYIQDLGITTLWLNPEIENDQPDESYHGYAATDFYAIDPRLGTNALYLELCKAANSRGIKMIRDVVFNHVGNEHWFIKDLPDPNWVHPHDSFVKTNYRATTLLDPYAADADRKLFSDGWFDTHMPDLDQRHPRLATYLIQNSIWWIEYAGLAGFRIDTYAYPDQVFMQKWAQAILKEYPDFTLFGETWVHGAPVQAFFTGKTKTRPNFDTHLSGVTDFQLYYAINEAMNGDFGWTDGVCRIYYSLAKDYLYDDPTRNVTFLDNHDLTRFYTVVNKDLKKFKMGIAFLLTTRGIPSLYYGTEILMDSPKPDHKYSREDFPGGWPGDPRNKFSPQGRSEVENDAFNYVRKLAQWRKAHTVLHDGKLMQFVPDDGVYTYFRYNDQETVMVIMNSKDKEVSLETGRFQERLKGFSRAENIVTGKKLGQITQIRVPGRTTMVLSLQP